MVVWVLATEPVHVLDLTTKPFSSPYCQDFISGHRQLAGWSKVSKCLPLSPACCEVLTLSWYLPHSLSVFFSFPLGTARVMTAEATPSTGQ